MRAATRLSFGALIAAAGLAVSSAAASAQASVHIGHVMDEFADTPEERGLLGAAAAEQAIVQQHVGLALDDPENLAALQLHAGHVINAIDPTVEEEGPGTGYGLRKAAELATVHIEMAAGADGASPAVRTMVPHISMASQNVRVWSEQILELAQNVRDSDDAEEAAEFMREIQLRSNWIRNGIDADEDGEIEPLLGESGLEQANTYLLLLKRAEGMGN